MPSLLALTLSMTPLLLAPTEAAEPEPFVCPATALLEDAMAEVEGGESTRALRARLGHALGEARASEEESEREQAEARCASAALLYTDLAQELGGADQAELLGPPVPKKVWPHSQARTQTIVSGSLFGVGLVMATLPWAIIQGQSCPNSEEGCGNIYATIGISISGALIAPGAAIGLGIWAYRLKHRTDGDPGLALGRSRARLSVAGQGLVLRF